MSDEHLETIEMADACLTEAVYRLMSQSLVRAEVCKCNDCIREYNSWVDFLNIENDEDFKHKYTKPFRSKPPWADGITNDSDI